MPDWRMRAAEHLLPAPRLLDERRRAGQARADRGAEALGEVQPRAVEAARPVGGVDAAGHHRVHQPRAVEVGRAGRARAGDRRARRAPARAARRARRPCSSSARRTPGARAARSGRRARSRGSPRSSASGVNMPLSPSTSVMTAPDSCGRAAGLGDQRVRVAPDEASRSPPGRMCRRMAISLHIVPLGRKTAASWPSSAATRSSSASVGRVRRSAARRRPRPRRSPRASPPSGASGCRSRGSTPSAPGDRPYRSYPRRARWPPRRLRGSQDPPRRAAQGAARRARRLPVPRRARARSSTSARPSRCKKRVASHFSNPVTRGAVRDGRRDRRRSSSCSSPPRPRRCWPSRTSSSSTGRASTSACATTSPIRSSRSRWTRTSRASTSRASATAATASTSGPYSNAKRVRGDARPARQGLPVPLLPGRRAGAALGLAVPGLLHQALRGALRRLRHARASTASRSTASSRSSPGATARSSATSSSG